MFPAFTPRSRPFVLTLCLCLGLCAQIVFAQPAEPIAPPPVQFSEDDEAVEMLTRGALHEAFADQVSQDLVTGELAPSAPPEAIDELPPEIKPDGDDVEWIPGYWYWDDERNDYIWISGVWRKTPPGRRWVPGYWTEVDGKYRRVSGVWSGAAVSSLEYLPYPPDSLELGPVSPSPSDDYFWVPGSWVYFNSGYSWRPGHWELYRNDWVWMPTRYVWSPSGCLYQAGYWDYPFASRGQLYSPVYFRNHIYQRPNFCFQPSLTISSSSIFLHLFVRSGHSHYYFGNYYGNQYHNRYYPWYNYQQVGRRYDPLITFAYGRSHHAGIDYVGRMRDWNRYFTSHADHRPPTTIKQQREFERSHQGFSQINQVTLGRSIQQTLHDGDSHTRSHRTSTTQQSQLRQHAAEVRTLTETRRNHEAHALPKQREGLAATSQHGLEAGRDGRGNGTNRNFDRSSSPSTDTAGTARGNNSERFNRERTSTDRLNSTRSNADRFSAERFNPDRLDRDRSNGPGSQADRLKGLSARGGNESGDNRLPSGVSRDDRVERGRINRASTGQTPLGQATSSPAGRADNAATTKPVAPTSKPATAASRPAPSSSNGQPRPTVTPREQTRLQLPSGAQPNVASTPKADQPIYRRNAPANPVGPRPATRSPQPSRPATSVPQPSRPATSVPQPAGRPTRSQPRTFFSQPRAATPQPRAATPQPRAATPQPRSAASQARPSFSRTQPQPSARSQSPVGPQRNAAARAAGSHGRQPKRGEG